MKYYLSILGAMLVFCIVFVFGYKNQKLPSSTNQGKSVDVSGNGPSDAYLSDGEGSDGSQERSRAKTQTLTAIAEYTADHKIREFENLLGPSLLNQDFSILSSDVEALFTREVGEKLNWQVGSVVLPLEIIGNQKLEGKARVVSLGIIGHSDVFFHLSDNGAGRISGRIMKQGSDIAFAISGKFDEVIMITKLRREYVISVCAKPPTPESAGESVSADPPPPPATPPLLSSRPSSENVLYLDFDGETVTSTRWNTVFTGGTSIVAAPADLSESLMTGAWNHIASDYAVWDVNVTTDRAAYDAADPDKRMMCIYTPTEEWYGDDAGGVAWLNSFGVEGDKVCWAFTSSFGSGKGLGEVGSHEFGHTLGLRHDGHTGDGEYYRGHGSGDVGWASIMGVGYYRNVTQFSRGEYDGARQGESDPNTQDDLVTIDSFISRLSDDYVGTTSGATNIAPVGGGVNQNGIIETSGDVDVFAVTSGPGAFTISAATIDAEGVDSIASNVAVQLELLDSSGTVLVSDNPSNTTDAEITYTSPSNATYYLRVTGAGRNDPATDGFSNYGSLGRYNLSGDLPFQPEIEVSNSDGSSDIPNGSTTISTGLGTDFGSIAPLTTSTNTFRITNSGLTVLNITSITISNPEFAVSVNPPSSIAADGGGSFNITYSPQASGGDTAIVTINSNDSDRSPYTFTIQGDANSAPEINVTSSDGVNNIPDGSTTISSAFGTDFGTISPLASASRTYRIQNTGSWPLDIGSITVDNAEFAITASATGTIAVGSSANLTIAYRPQTNGSDTATVTINNSDSDENPYTFEIQGNANTTAEIHLTAVDGTSAIPSGSTTIDAGLGTDFGSLLAGGNVLRNFIVFNQGADPLLITNVSSNVADFTVSGLVTSIAANSSDQFQVLFNPSVFEVQTATITIRSSDQDEGGYTFMVQGEGSEPPPANVGPVSTREYALTQTNLGGGYINVSWGSVLYAETYKLYRKVNDGSYEEIATLNGTSYSDFTVSSNNAYSYKVEAINNSGSSESDATPQHMLGSVALVSPVEDTFEVRPQFSWTAHSQATRYQLLINKDGQSFLNQWIDGQVTWMPSDRLELGLYEWWIKPWGPQVGDLPISYKGSFSVVDSSSDLDGNGIGDLTETALAVGETSALAITKVGAGVEVNTNLRRGVFGLAVIFESSPDMVTWTQILSITNDGAPLGTATYRQTFLGGNRQVVIEDTASDVKKFFRLRTVQL